MLPVTLILNMGTLYFRSNFLPEGDWDGQLIDRFVTQLDQVSHL